jgi:hypothetical protein
MQITYKPCDMPCEFGIGVYGTGTNETYETNVTYATGVWDLGRYVGVCGASVRKTTPKPKQKFIGFVLKSHVTCLLNTQSNKSFFPAFIIQHSAFIIHNSAFIIHNSAFIIHNSAFSILRI